MSDRDDIDSERRTENITMRYPSSTGVLLTASLVCCLAVTLGCTSLSESARTAGSGFTKATSPMMQSWRRATGSGPNDAIVVWDWTTGVPVDAPRGELLAATLRGDAVAHFLPQLTTSDIQLVSAPGNLGGYEIRNIEGQVVDDCSDLYTALEQVSQSATDVQVDLARIGARSDASETAVKVDPSTLMALAQSIAPETTAFRVSEGGNPTFVIRDGGIRTHVVLRVERRVGVVQLVITLANCGADERLLPVEVGARCDNEPLQCLSVASTLELLYGEPDADLNATSQSFSETSEREDYLLPVNYKRLSRRDEGRRGLMTQSPAFASLTGMRYPGTALLGDARALTGIMLQQQKLNRGEQSETGWILFAGEQLHTAEHVDVSIDLGNGPKSYRFMIPKTH